MPLILGRFPLIPGGARIHFYDSFGVPRTSFNEAHVLTEHAHEAIDVQADRGTPVLSTINGTVVRRWVSKKNRRTLTGCGWSDAGGNIVAILDDRGYVHYFAHLNMTPLVQEGDKVSSGRLIGYVGNTGSIAQGSHTHLHYQVWVVGSGRDAEVTSGLFVRPFGRSVNPYPELVRLARGMGAQVSRNGGVDIR